MDVSYTTVVTQRSAEHRTLYIFAGHDRKGRQMGTSITRWEEDLEETNPAADRAYYNVAPGHYYCFQAHATRANKPYGPMQPQRRFVTAAERDAAIVQYLKGAHQRAHQRDQ